MKVSTAKRPLFELRSEWQARSSKSLDQEHVARMVEALEDGADLPPLSVVKLEDGSLALVDGYHRFAAYEEAGRDRFPFRIVGEGMACVMWHVAHANHDHGKSRALSDKRESVRIALAAPEAGDMDNRAISRWCGVSVDLVREVREEVLGAPSAAAERRQRAEEVAAAKPEATPGQIAKEAGVSRSVARRARRQIVEPERQREVVQTSTDPRLDHPVDETPLPFEPEAEPEWRGLAAACDRLADAIVAVKRQHSGALKVVPGGQEIVDHLTRAHGIATRRKPEACPVPECRPGRDCPVCNAKGYTLGKVDGWEGIVAAAQVVNG